MSLSTYSIQEASARTNVSKHTLRFWEKAFNGIIVPMRTEGGQRRYTADNLFMIEEIKRLKKKGLNLVDIKKILEKTGIKEPTVQNNNIEKIDILANRIAEVVKSALYNFIEEEKSGKKV
jgi:DNA-binding transcriptional MerR regulator